MSHDFAKKKKPAVKKTATKKKRKTAPKNQIPGWVWLFTGIVTGLFIAFLFHLADINPAPKSAEQAVAGSKQNAAVEEEEVTETKFDFYTLLPEREVIIPEQRQPSNASKQPAVEYILQAGSFRSGEDADWLRARLLLMGLEAKVDKVGNGGDIWHRVQVGPFTSRSKLSKTRSMLINDGIETLLLKRKVEA